MNLLVTGIAGFIGSSFIEYMLDKYPNYKFIGIDKLTYCGNIENIEHLFNKPNFIFEYADICDNNKMEELFKKYKFDIVINFCAESHVDNSIKNPFVFYNTNIIGTGVLLEKSQKYNIKRFHQVSTDEVYGSLKIGEKKFNEKSMICPSNPYAATKASADLLILSFVNTYGLNATISRCSNNYGKRQYPEKLIPLVIEKALNNEEIPVYGTGENIRDWINVEDHIRGIDLVIHKGKKGEVYNFGGNCEKTNLEIVKTILKELGKPESLIKFVSDRPGHDLRYAMDTTKAEKKLGWHSTIPFEQGIKDTIKWYLDNELWLSNIKSNLFQEKNNKYKNLNC